LLAEDFQTWATHFATISFGESFLLGSATVLVLRKMERLDNLYLAETAG
jgi:hypothetical protein